MTIPLDATYATPRAGGRQRPATPPFDPPAGGDRTMIGQGAKAATAQRSGPGSGYSVSSSRLSSAPRCLEPDPRNPSWPAVFRPRRQAGYMTAPRPHANAAKNPLAKHGPSIHVEMPRRPGG